MLCSLEAYLYLHENWLSRRPGGDVESAERDEGSARNTVVQSSFTVLK